MTYHYLQYLHRFCLDASSNRVNRFDECTSALVRLTFCLHIHRFFMHFICLLIDSSNFHTRRFIFCMHSKIFFCCLSFLSTNYLTMGLLVIHHKDRKKLFLFDSLTKHLCCTHLLDTQHMLTDIIYIHWL